MVYTLSFIIFFLGSGFNFLNLLIFKFINIFFISFFLFYDSLFNVCILNYSYFFNKKILIGKKYNQFSLLKKSLYIKYVIFYKKYFIFSRLKCGDVNFFSRINNDIVYISSYKLFYFILSGSTIAFYSFSILNFFLTYRINFSNIIFYIYLNSLNVFKLFNCFLNKSLIFYMINNNIFYLFDYIELSNSFYLFFFESSNFYSDHLYIFNFYDIFFTNILNSFFFLKYPKYLILNNYFNFINFIDFLIFLF